MPRRPWYRFSLRTFFLLLMLFGTWLAVQVNWVRERHAAYAWLSHHNFPASYYLPWHSLPESPPWLIILLNEKAISRIELNEWNGDLPSEPQIERLQDIFPEATVYITDKQGTTLPPRPNRYGVVH